MKTKVLHPPPFHCIPNFPNGLTKQQGGLQYFHFCLFSFTYFQHYKDFLNEAAQHYIYKYL